LAAMTMVFANRSRECAKGGATMTRTRYSFIEDISLAILIRT
jgi:hypothetical protein